MPIIILFLIIVAALAAFEIAAMRWGYDSRDGFRPSRHTRPSRDNLRLTRG